MEVAVNEATEAWRATDTMAPVARSVLSPSTALPAVMVTSSAPSSVISSVTSSSSGAAPSVIIKTYHRRWYILAVYSLLGFMQCAIWNTWGPITQAALLAFPHWTELTISCLTNIGLISFLVCMAPYCWLLDKKGVRPAVVTMALCLALGTSMRCFTLHAVLFDVFAFISAALAGVAGVMALAAPPYISALWFPPHQRTTATGVPNILNQLGMSGSFLLGPLVVSQPNRSVSLASHISAPPSANLSAHHSVSGRVAGWLAATARDIVSNTTSDDVINTRHEIMNLMYIDAGICCALLLLVLLYFPSRPALPPSVSASTSSVSFRQGLAMAVRHRDLLCIMMTYSLSQGVMGSWFGVMDINLSSLGVSEDEVGWLGVWAGSCCCVFALLVARLTDTFRGHIKPTICVLLGVGCAHWAWLLAIVAGWAPYSLVYLYCAVLISVSCTYAASPLLFEYASELSYPVPEDVVGAVMSFCFNLVGALYLLFFLNKHLAHNTVWLNYCLVGASGVALLMMVLTSSQYRRSAVDAAAGLAHAVETVSGYRPL